MTGKHNAPEFQEQLDVRINGEGGGDFFPVAC